MASILFIPMLLYSAASFIVSVILRRIGTCASNIANGSRVHFKSCFGLSLHFPLPFEAEYTRAIYGKIRYYR